MPSVLLATAIILALGVTGPRPSGLHRPADSNDLNVCRHRLWTIPRPHSACEQVCLFAGTGYGQFSYPTLLVSRLFVPARYHAKAHDVRRCQHDPELYGQI